MRWEGHIDMGRPDDEPVVAPKPNRYNQLANLVLPERQPAPLLPSPIHQITMEVDHPARQGVVVHTSATDRARGFQWMIAPISAVVAVLALIVSLFFKNELFSLISLLIFWGSFCLVYVAGWLATALLSAEFVSLFSAWCQWDVIGREQAERWVHYRNERIPWYIEFKPLIYIGVVVSLFLGAALVAWAILLWG